MYQNGWRMSRTRNKGPKMTKLNLILAGCEWPPSASVAALSWFIGGKIGSMGDED